MVVPKFFKNFLFTLPFFLLSMALSILFITLSPYYQFQNIKLLISPTPTPTPTNQTYADELHQLSFQYPFHFKFVKNDQDKNTYVLETPQNNQIRFIFSKDKSKTISDYLQKLDKINSTAWEGQPSIQVNSTQKTKINDFSVIVRGEYLLAADINITSTYFKIGDYILSLSYIPVPGNPTQSDFNTYQQVLNSIQNNKSESQLGYINNAYILDNKNFIDIDYLAIINDPKKPNGFYIQNNNPLIRKFEVSPTAIITIIDYKSNNYQKIIDFNEFIQYLKYSVDKYPYDIALSNNIITKITARYLP